MGKPQANIKDTTVIHRLRSGHTLLTHIPLMSYEPVPPSELYHIIAMTVKHLLLECPNLDQVRNK